MGPPSERAEGSPALPALERVGAELTRPGLEQRLPPPGPELLPSQPLAPETQSARGPASPSPMESISGGSVGAKVGAAYPYSLPLPL